MNVSVKLLLAAALAALLLQGCATPLTQGPPETLFKDGEQLFQNGKYEDAIAQWKRVKESYKSPELSAQAEIGIADAYFLNKDYIEAAAGYEDFRKLHPSHPQAEYALFRQGLSNYNQIHGIDTDQTPVKNALTIFESYLKLYPAGQYQAQAREKLADCHDKQLQYELYVGDFYLRTGKYQAAIGRYEEALLRFPDQPRRDQVLYGLGRAYLENGQKSKGREAFGRLIRDFPASPYIPEANKVMDSFF